MSILRKLDPIIWNKFANDAATLAEWTSASHIERELKHKPAPPALPESAGGAPPA